MEESKRVFICVQFSDSVIKEVARVQEILGKQRFTGKMTELENLHLTLKFLGEIDREKIEKVKEKLKEIKFEKFSAKLSDIGTFAFHGNPRIIWIKIGGRDIFELQSKIDDSLSELFKKEERFMSHMTIARIKYVKDKDGFREYVKNIGIKDIEFTIGKFILMESKLEEQGPVYTEIEEYREK